MPRLRFKASLQRVGEGAPSFPFHLTGPHAGRKIRSFCFGSP